MAFLGSSYFFLQFVYAGIAHFQTIYRDLSIQSFMLSTYGKWQHHIL